MASYPGSVKSFTTKIDGVTTVAAVDVNEVQDEIAAVQTTLGTSPATSVLGTASIGTYTAVPGALANVSARIKNIEAGLTGDSTTGARIGYTQLAQQTLTTSGGGSTVTFSTISGNYQKLVLQIDFTSIGTSAALSVTLNGVATNYIYTRQVYGSATPDTSTTATAFLIGTPVVSTTPTYVIEIPNYARTGQGKVMTSLGPTLSMTGYLITGAVTTVAVSAGSSTLSATVTLIGVK